MRVWRLLVRFLACSLVAIVFKVSVCAGQNVPQLFERKGGLVPDQQTAVRIAEAVLFPIYGEKTIRDQRPYQIKLENGKWTIDGSLPPGMVGGTFHIVILQRDARVLEVGHGA